MSTARICVNKSLKIKLALSLSILIGLIGFPTSLIFRFDFFIFPTLFIGFFFPFLILLEYKTERVLKGLFVILYGIFWGIVIPEIFEQYIPESFEQNMEIFKNLAVFACSGAGGSIIASHSEEQYKKEEKPIAKEIVVDKTQKIETLISSVEDLKKTTVRIHVAYGVVLFIGFVVFAI
jgi:hypothetical protein